MNKHQRSVIKCTVWLFNTFDITWREAKITARQSVKSINKEYSQY